MFRTLLFISLFAFTISNAQPVLNSNEMAGPGMKYFYKSLQTFTSIDTTIQGPNCTWNFTGVTSVTSPDFTIETFDPAQTPYAAQFPTANWGYVENTNQHYAYFNKTSTTLERIGGYDIFDGFIYYTDPQVEYVFPLTLGTINDDVAIQSGSAATDYNLACIGYGTLMVPGHTYNDVLLVRVYIDFAFTEFYIYYWYDSNNGITLMTYTEGDNLFVFESGNYLDNVSTGINEMADTDIRYTNPVKDIMDVFVSSPFPASFQYELVNPLGEVVTSGNISQVQGYKFSVDMSAFSKGLYFLSVREQGRLNDYTFKVVKAE